MPPPTVLKAPLTAEALDAVAGALRSGAVVVHPTETVYGLGAALDQEGAQVRIFRLKGRPSGSPLIVLVPGADWLDRLGRRPAPPIRRLVEVFWPGPLSVVIPASAAVPGGVRAGGSTVALRWSPDPTVAGIVARVGPITSTSANVHGAPPPVRVEDCTWRDEGPDLIVDDGPRRGRGSTLVAVAGPGSVRILREGDLPLERIRAVVDVVPGAPPCLSG